MFLYSVWFGVFLSIIISYLSTKTVPDHPCVSHCGKTPLADPVDVCGVEMIPVHSAPALVGRIKRHEIWFRFLVVR